MTITNKAQNNINIKSVALTKNVEAKLVISEDVRLKD